MSSSSASDDPQSRPSIGRTSTGESHHSQLAARKTDIKINVYDLLPPGRLSTVLWTIGGSLLHSGVVIGNKEYAYGGHDRRGLTGVYFTKPQETPPGGTFRIEILHGFTMGTAAEIDEVIKEASEAFLGTSYNLLTKNCNHFTSYLCEKLTGRSAPRWLNRAASIGVALPCVVPKDWIAPPEYDDVDGELLDDNSDDEDERTSMLRKEQRRMMANKDSDDDLEAWNRGSVGSSSRNRYVGDQPARPVTVRDTGGRELPNAERAPVPTYRR